MVQKPPGGRRSCHRRKGQGRDRTPHCCFLSLLMLQLVCASLLYYPVTLRACLGDPLVAWLKALNLWKQAPVNQCLKVPLPVWFGDTRFILGESPLGWPTPYSCLKFPWRRPEAVGTHVIGSYGQTTHCGSSRWEETRECQRFLRTHIPAYTTPASSISPFLFLFF